MILLRHHSIPFKLVHSVLAVVLVGLAVRAIKSLGQRPGQSVDARSGTRAAAINRG
jgi:hypothetical protein